MYQNLNSPIFNIEIFEDVGRALCAGILDLIEDNPISRIPLSAFKNISNVRNDIELNLAKYENGNPGVPGANHFRNTNTKVA
jgi:hypothetical protein